MKNFRKEVADEQWIVMIIFTSVIIKAADMCSNESQEVGNVQYAKRVSTLGMSRRNMIDTITKRMIHVTISTNVKDEIK